MRRSKLLFRPPSYTLQKDKRSSIKTGNYILYFRLGERNYSFSTFTSNSNRANETAEELVNQVWEEWRQKKMDAFLRPSPTPGVLPFSSSDSNKGFITHVHTEHSGNLPPPLLVNGEGPRVPRGNSEGESKGVGQPALFHSGANNGTNGQSGNGVNVKIGQWSNLPAKLKHAPDSVENMDEVEYVPTTQLAVIKGLNLRQTFNQFFTEWYIEDVQNSTLPLMTLDAYRKDGERWLRILVNVGCSLEEIDFRKVEWLYMELVKDCEKETCKKSVTQFKCFIIWALRSNLINEDPLKLVKFDWSNDRLEYGGTKRNMSIWTDEQLEEILPHFTEMERFALCWYFRTGMDMCDIACISEQSIVKDSHGVPCIELKRKKSGELVTYPLEDGTLAATMISELVARAREGKAGQHRNCRDAQGMQNGGGGMAMVV